ncbi:hypothetical protein C6N01_13525 [Enterococcus faecalis]|uniref:hypothetical protein n=1 Tax=Enterococcus faecalis TaxID=1351 RepID=UPI0013624344|nr:hypothetical protein [Enterococcus faecalis]NBJ47222.1 hypothetical protein [Enterococcus faecalis]
MKITFICDAEPDLNSNKFNIDNAYKIVREVSDSDSVTEIAKEVIVEYNNSMNGRFKGITKQIPVGLCFNPESGQKYYETFPDFYFNKKNEVVFFNFSDKLEYNWSLKELKNMKRAGHIKNDISVIYIFVPQGIGGPGPFTEFAVNFLTQFLSGLLSEVAVDYVNNKIKNAFTKKETKEIQRIANYWVKNQGVHSPQQLRTFITKKGNWELKELATNLNISQEFAMKLLICLGYEFSDNQFIPSYTEEATQHRKKWEDTETLLRSRIIKK